MMLNFAIFKNANKQRSNTSTIYFNKEYV